MLQKARQAVRGGRWKEAIDRYREHLDAAPRDLEAWLELGFTYLLAEDRERFLSIYRRIGEMIGAAAVLPARVKNLWSQYGAMAARFTAAAALGTSLAVAGGVTGCSKKSGTPEAVITETKDAGELAGAGQAPDAAAQPPEAQEATAKPDAVQDPQGTEAGEEAATDAKEEEPGKKGGKNTKVKNDWSSLGHPRYIPIDFDDNIE